MVLFGVDVDGDKGYGGYIVGASLDTGDPVWQYQTDVDAQGDVLDDGCGSVWSSGTVLPAAGLVVFGTADCDFSNAEPLSESVIALHIHDGHLAWSYRPARPDAKCDWDFGATRQRRGRRAGGTPRSSARDARTGPTTRSTPPPGSCGGRPTSSSAGSPAGSSPRPPTTARGCTARPPSATSAASRATAPKVVRPVEPPRHAVAEAHRRTPSTPAPGAVPGRSTRRRSFAPTTVAGGMTFNGLAFAARPSTCATRPPAASSPRSRLPRANWSGIATVGDALVLGLGSTYNATARRHRGPDPGRGAPVVP